MSIWCKLGNQGFSFIILSTIYCNSCLFICVLLFISLLCFLFHFPLFWISALLSYHSILLLVPLLWFEIWWKKKKTGDITQRLCTAAEVKFYLNSLFERSSRANYLKPNKNCNLTSWVSGCEAGWACSASALSSQQQVDLRNSQEVPARTTNCQPCCEGFFCPHGIACMIRKYNENP